MHLIFTLDALTGSLMTACFVEDDINIKKSTLPDLEVASIGTNTAHHLKITYLLYRRDVYYHCKTIKVVEHLKTNVL